MVQGLQANGHTPQAIPVAGMADQDNGLLSESAKSQINGSPTPSGRKRIVIVGLGMVGISFM